jgi:hypothetical protein
MAVVAHTFNNGNFIEPYTNNPTWGRLIVAQHTEEFVRDKQGGTFFKETTRVAFVKGKVEDLNKRFGHLTKGQLFSDKLTIIKEEQLEPFWEADVEVKQPDGTVKVVHKKQPCKVKPAKVDANGVEVRAAEPVLHDGKPVYMQFSLAPAGSLDVQRFEVEAPVEEPAESGELAE